MDRDTEIEISKRVLSVSVMLLCFLLSSLVSQIVPLSLSDTSVFVAPYLFPELYRLLFYLVLCAASFVKYCCGRVI